MKQLLVLSAVLAAHVVAPTPPQRPYAILEDMDPAVYKREAVYPSAFEYGVQDSYSGANFGRDRLFWPQTETSDIKNLRQLWTAYGFGFATSSTTVSPPTPRPPKPAYTYKHIARLAY